MSEDFDKEAERERLREKYEADREDREATERMSELLLQGATMTNRHCNTCGSPIFRYQGQEFCPTCQEERGQAAAAEGEQQGQDGAAGTPQQGATEAAQEGTGGTGQQKGATGPSQQGATGPAQDDATEAGAAAGAETAATGSATPASGTGEPAPSAAERPGTGRAPPETQDVGTAPGEGGQFAASSSGQAAGSLDDARATLVRTITSLARRAEGTEDPRQAKELLAAAREAAETLSRLRGS